MHSQDFHPPLFLSILPYELGIFNFIRERAKLVLHVFFRENTFSPRIMFSCPDNPKNAIELKKTSHWKICVLQTVLSDIARLVIFFSA